MYRLRFAVSVLVIGLLTSGFLLGEDKKTEKEPIIVTVKLPTGYSKLGLSAKQKKTLLKIRGEYAAKIEELKNQIKELQEKEKADLENVLSDAQKSRLRELSPSGASKGGEIKEQSSEAKEKPADVNKK
jgi:myo-inositol-1-phosphate synthase